MYEKINMNKLRSFESMCAVSHRFDAGDQEVRDAMRQFAGFAEEAESAIEKEDYSTFADLMEKVLCENICFLLK